MQRSDTIADLAAALVKARAKFKPLKKGHTANVQSSKGSYKYTYSTLDDLYEATDAALCEFGLMPMHNIETSRDGVGVSTLILHTSGQFIQTDPVWLPGGSTPQSIGSACTYARRYSLQAALGIAAEEDDDGQRAAKPAPRRESASESHSSAPRAATPDDRIISDAQRKRLFAIAKGKGWSDDDIKKLLAAKGYTSSKDVRLRDYDALVKTVETGELADDDDADMDAPWPDDPAQGVQ